MYINFKVFYVMLVVPLDSPQNFEIENVTLNSTSAKFSWIPVDTSLERIRGFFKGYRVGNSTRTKLFISVQNIKFGFVY